MEKLEGKVAIVTGGGTGIGRAIAIKFASAKAKVVVGRRENPLKETAEENANISYVVGDLTKSEDIARVIDFVKEKYGKLDILINNAGWCPVQSIKEITMDDYNKAFDLDVKSLVEMTIKSLPFLLESKGNIINLSTVGVRHQNYNLSMYVGAKSAVEGFTKVWALDLANDGVRVNAIAPGAIKTDIWNATNLSEAEEREHEHRITDGIPVKRFGKPEEVANVALFLASADASYVTGSIYSVDGGQDSL